MDQIPQQEQDLTIKEIEGELHVIMNGGINQNLIVQHKVELSTVQCPICLNVLWKPVQCGQDRCYQSFCEQCINYQLNYNPQHSNQLHALDSALDGEEFDNYQIQSYKKCPNCKRNFIKTVVPIVNSLLSTLVVQCFYQQNGC